MNKAPDKIFYNGRIYSMDNKNSLYEAIAIYKDKILSIGTDREILNMKAAGTELFDLKGHAAIPGIIETHSHIFSAGLSELKGEKFIPQSVKELLDYIRENVIYKRPGEIFYFSHIYPTRLKEYRFPTLKELDEAAPDNPVCIDGMYAVQVNSYALGMLGIDENTPEPAIGKFIRDTESGKLTGLLFRCGEILSNLRKSADGSIEDIVEGFKKIQFNYNKYGITSVIDGITDESYIKALNVIFNEGSLNLRISLTAKVTCANSAMQRIRSMKSLLELPSEWGRLSFLKVSVDGGILTGTAFMRKPYHDQIGMFGINNDHFRGIISYTSEELVGFIDAAFKSGLQMTAHCIGDAATDLLLDAYEMYQKKENINNRRFTILHCDFTDRETLHRIKKMNLCVLFQPAWKYMDGDILIKVLDAETMHSFLPYKQYINMQISAAAGSDHMVKYDPLLSQNPYNPFLALYNMVTGKTRFGTCIDPENCISRKEALAMYTRNAAYAAFDESCKGTLEAGKFADFAILSDDYFNCEEEKIKNICSEMTVAGGKIVYKNS